MGRVRRQVFLDSLWEACDFGGSFGHAHPDFFAVVGEIFDDRSRRQGGVAGNGEDPKPVNVHAHWEPRPRGGGLGAEGYLEESLEEPAVVDPPVSDDGGCCAVDGAGPTAAWPALAVLGLLAGRRRRRGARFTVRLPPR